MLLFLCFNNILLFLVKKTPFANLPYVKDGELIITETPAV